MQILFVYYLIFLSDKSINGFVRNAKKFLFAMN